MNWFENHEVPLRGHAVFWSVDKHVQDWVKGLSKVKKINLSFALNFFFIKDELRNEVFQRTDAAVGRYKKRIPNWDVFNEVMHGDFYKRNLGDQIWDDVIDRMKFIDPSVKIFFNDYQLLTSDYGQENLRISRKNCSR